MIINWWLYIILFSTSTIYSVFTSYMLVINQQQISYSEPWIKQVSVWLDHKTRADATQNVAQLKSISIVLSADDKH